MRILLGAAVIASVAGCAMPMDDMLNNQFSSVVPSAPPHELVGNWTGSSGPYLMTLVIRKDGSGLSCHAWNERNAVSRAKYRDGFVYLQDGTRMRVSSSGSGLAATTSYSGATPLNFVPDPDLREAAPFCAKSL